MLNNGKHNLGKFNAKSDEGIFLGYSLTSKAFRVFNKRTLVVEESIHVLFHNSNPLPRKNLVNDDIGILQEEVEQLNLDKDDSKKEEPLLEEEQQIEQVYG